jgi:hypothetical protein
VTTIYLPKAAACATPFVSPAKAGAHLLTSRNRTHLEMDSRVRGNDEDVGWSAFLLRAIG